MPWAQIALAFLTDGPQMLEDAEEIFHTVAHGNGGIAKITNVVASLTHLLGHANAALDHASSGTKQS